MEDYIKYQHVEKLGSDEVDGILIGSVYVFPKIDGTNAHAWSTNDGGIHFGSRKRELTIDNDNAGFMAAMLDNHSILSLLRENEGVHVYGEWLVPHSLKTYRDAAWRKFYVFDVIDSEGNYWPFERLQDECKHYGLDFIPPLRIIKNPTIDNLMKLLPDNIFLIEDGEGAGEGVVLKNYAFSNKYGRTTWAKIVTSEFKERHAKEMGAPITNGTKMVEEDIVNEYVTDALVEKTHAKIKLEEGEWNSKMIGQLLGRVFHDLVKEHSWDICKKYKMPKVDYKNLNRFCIMRIKEAKPELF